MKPHSHEEHIQHSFDAFCKKVLRNEARDYQDALARKRNREVYFSELPVEVLEQFAVRDTYFTDSRTFEVIGHSVCIDDETLAEAISLCLLTAEILSCCPTSSICPTLKLQMC